MREVVTHCFMHSAKNAGKRTFLRNYPDVYVVPVVNVLPMLLPEVAI